MAQKGADTRATTREQIRPRLLWPAIGLGVIALLATGFVFWKTTIQSCAERTSIDIVADPAMSETISTAAAAVPHDQCFDYTVRRVAAADIPSVVTDGNRAPDLWVADSSERARRVLGQVQKTPDYVTESLAQTPTVVVGKNLKQPDSWQAVINQPNLRMGSPVDTSTGDSPIVGALSEVADGRLSEKELRGSLATLAQRQNDARPANETDATRLVDAANTGDTTLTTEQQFLEYTNKHSDSGLQQAIPATGAVVLNFPLVNTTNDDKKRDKVAEGGRALTAALETETGQRALNDAGFRSADGTGVGDPIAPVKQVPEEMIDSTLRQWQVLALPMRTIVALDASGSMEKPAGDGTRAELLVGAAKTALQILPNSAQVGGWIFGINKGGPGQDWFEFTPIRRLDADVDGKTQRQVLGEETTKAMTTRLGGGTGLYDTTLAAFKAVQAGWDPKYSNSVIIMTDGANQDKNGISLDDLLAELKKLQDPSKPVIVVTIGMSDEADTDALKQIAEATGGTTHIERKPEDVNHVLVDSISARVAAAAKAGN